MNAERRFYTGVLLGVYVLWAVAFETVGHYASTLPAHDLSTRWDHAIPLVPWFIYPYEFCYVFPLLPLSLVRDWHRMNRALLSFVMTSVTAFALYLVFPVAFPRPELGTSLSERVLTWEYAWDFQPGANKWPSLHVANAWLIYFACRRQGWPRVVDLSILSVVVLIMASTLFVKQHILVDVISGTILAAFAWSAAAWLYPRLTDPGLAPPVALRQMFRRGIAPLSRESES